MIKVGKVELGNIPRIALSVSDLEDNKLIKPSLVDMLEIRVDQFRKLTPIYIRDVIKLRKEIGAPLILTIRSRAEGGKRDITNKLKLNIIEENIDLVDAVDIELKSPILSKVVKFARKNNKPVIVSWHNLKATPNDKTLKHMLTKAIQSGADLIKIAVKANKESDVNRLAKFTIENKSKNIITISLGKIGSISRITFPGIGSLITYTYINKPQGPGQIALDKLQNHLQVYYHSI